MCGESCTLPALFLKIIFNSSFLTLSAAQGRKGYFGLKNALHAQSLTESNFRHSRPPKSQEDWTLIAAVCPRKLGIKFSTGPRRVWRLDPTSLYRPTQQHLFETRRGRVDYKCSPAPIGFKHDQLGAARVQTPGRDPNN